MLSAKEVAALAAKALDAKMGEDIRLIGITDETSEAVRMIYREDADMMIADTSASDGDSIGRLQKESVSIPIIFISEYSEDAERVRNLNMVDFILKPVTPSDLERAFSRLDSLNNNL